MLSAGCAVQLTDAVLEGKIKNGFGILRPPGHHAMFDEVCGYCYFNNVAISAKHALAKGSFTVQSGAAGFDTGKGEKLGNSQADWTDRGCLGAA